MNKQKDPNSLQIKVAILTCLAKKSNGDSKTNVIGEEYLPVGSIERYFDIRLSSEQRHDASKCFDELRSIDFIRSNNITDENWVVITASGLEALESGLFRSPRHGVDVAAKYVFLDIVGFTRNRPVEAQSDVVSRLNDIVTRVIAEQGVPADKRIFIPTGDGICITLISIESPVDIHLQIALRILEQLATYNSSTQDDARRIHVRIGVDAGEDVLVTDINGQQNIAGAGISMASRIMDLADVGQILIGDRVYSTLRHREKYANQFKLYNTTVKHETPLSVYQFIGEGHNGLNVEPPRRLAANSETKNTPLTSREQFSVAPAIKPIEEFRIDQFRINNGVITGPLVIPFGPREIGKTVTILRLAKYINLYDIRPNENFRRDPIYPSTIAAFEKALLDSHFAPAATGDTNVLLLDVIYHGGKFCQILEAPGEHFFDLNDPRRAYPAYLNQILNSSYRKVFLFFFELNMLTSDEARRNYADRIARLILERISATRDSVVIVCNKCDLQTFFRSGRPIEAEFRNVLYNGSTFGRLIDLLRERGFGRISFVPFSAGNFTNDGTGRVAFTLSPDVYPQKLWQAIHEVVQGRPWWKFW